MTEFVFFLLACSLSAAILAAIFKTWKSARHWRWSRQLRLFYEQHFAIVAVCLFVGIVIFGALGLLEIWWRGLAKQSPNPSGWDQYGYELLRLVMLGADPNIGSTVYTMCVARVFSSLLTLLLGYEVARRLAAQSIANYRVMKLSNHVVICGLGSIGQQLVTDLCRVLNEDSPKTPSVKPRFRPTAVIVIEPNANHPAIQWARDQGAMVIIGDANNRDVLNHVRAKTARRLYAVTESDDVNANIAMEVFAKIPDAMPDTSDSTEEYPKKGATVSERSRILAHVLDPELGQALRDMNPLVKPSVRVEFFNVYRNAALDVLSRGVNELRPQPNRPLHDIVMGFGPMGQMLALTLAEFSHFANCQRPRMTILDSNISTRSSEFLARFPHFAPELRSESSPWNPLPQGDDWSDRTLRSSKWSRFDGPEAESRRACEFVCNATFGAFAGDAATDEIAEQIAKLDRETNSIGGVYLCLEDESKNFATATRLRTRLLQHGVTRPIYVWLRSATCLYDFCDHPGIIPFGACHQSCSFDALEGRKLQMLAKVFHAQYAETCDDVNVDISTETFDVFDEIPAAFRESNRSAAIHSGIKLAHVKQLKAEFQKKFPGKDFKVANEAVDLLGRMEHNRWIAERLLANWIFGPKDDLRRSRETLCPWDNLTDGEKKYDLDQVCKLLKVYKFPVEAT